MPNHVTTRLTVTGPDEYIAEFKKLMFVEHVDNNGAHYTRFDFKRIIPMPSILEGLEESSVAEEAAALIIMRGDKGAPFRDGGLYPAQINNIRRNVDMMDAPIHEVAERYLSKYPDKEAIGRRRLQAILETGYVSWYPWSIANWGTKWNSYDFREVNSNPLEITFQTAWSFPWPVFHALRYKFHKLHFHCVCFDEGWGFAGKGYFNPPDGEPVFNECEATNDLYREVYGRDPEEDEEDE